jgi:predicted RNA-binding Zn-ribbon protein involved in translation (DUF1610 family)
VPTTIDASDRLVLHPRGFGAFFFSGLMLVPLLLSIGAVIEAFRQGRWVIGLVFAAIALGICQFLVYVWGAKLWADADSVGTRQIFYRRTCPRREIAAIQVGVVYGRAPACNFLRKDNSVAFFTARLLWSRRQLQRMADFLGVPIIKGPIKAIHGYVCPVCGYHGLERPASSNGFGSGELCPCCGFDHTGRVDAQRYAQWRAEWTSNGMAWWASQAGVPVPEGWDPEAQLENLSA